MKFGSLLLGVILAAILSAATAQAREWIVLNYEDHSCQQASAIAKQHHAPWMTTPARARIAIRRMGWMDDPSIIPGGDGRPAAVILGVQRPDFPEAYMVYFRDVDACKAYAATLPNLKELN